MAKQASDIADHQNMNKQILILDDDRDFARTMAEQLRSLPNDSSSPLDVEIAFDTVQATLKLNLSPPDLICLDIDLSADSGLAFCEYIAWNSDFARIPIVVMTRRHDFDDIRRSCSLDLHFVDKSVDSWDEFAKEIHGIMDQAKFNRRVADPQHRPQDMLAKNEIVDMRLAGPFTSR